MDQTIDEDLLVYDGDNTDIDIDYVYKRDHNSKSDQSCSEETDTEEVDDNISHCVQEQPENQKRRCRRNGTNFYRRVTEVMRGKIFCLFDERKKFQIKL